jgi:leucyl aminopeptidase
MDLSAAKCKGGLGAVATDINGFGVAWGVEFLKAMLGR